MVHLNRITTRGGDDGTTGLGDGTRVTKTDPRIAALGSLDEVNAAIGLALASTDVPAALVTSLRSVQNDLFDLGAEICFPAETRDAESFEVRPHITSESLERLERQTEASARRLEPLDSFLLPGGSPLAAQLHVARAVCRRAEREVLVLADQEPVRGEVRQYLNRLSDLLFVLARLANDQGRDDILWQPGG